MRINPIGLGYGNLKPNKIEKNNSKIISNPVEGSQKLAKLSLEQLQGMNNISFRGNGYNQNETIRILSTLYENRTTDNIQDFFNEAMAILNSPLLKTDENGRTFFHKASSEDLEAKRQEITPQILKIALPIKDNYGKTCLNYKENTDFANTVANILGDKVAEFYTELYGAKNKNGMTPIEIMIANDRQDELQALLENMGKNAIQFIRNYKGKDGNTIFHYPLKPTIANGVIKTLGKEAKNILCEMIPMQNDHQKTFAHYVQYPETIKTYAKTLNDKTYATYTKAYTTKDKEGQTPIDIFIRNNERQNEFIAFFESIGKNTAKFIENYRSKYGDNIYHKHLDDNIINNIVRLSGKEAPEVLTKLYTTKNDNGLTPIDCIFSSSRRCEQRELKILFNIMSKKTAKFVRNYKSKDGKTIFHYPLNPEVANIMIKNLGNEAKSILSEMLPIQNNNKETFLHCRQNPKTIKLYAQNLGNQASEIYKAAYRTKNQNGHTPAFYYSYDDKKLIQAIIKGEKV